MNSGTLTKKDIIKIFKRAFVESPASLLDPSSIERYVRMCTWKGAGIYLSKDVRAECVAQENDFDGSEICRVIFKITYNITPEAPDFYICALGYYNSWGDNEYFTQVYECEPFERTIVDWRKVSSPTSKNIELVVKKKRVKSKTNKIKKKTKKKKK